MQCKRPTCSVCGNKSVKGDMGTNLEMCVIIRHIVRNDQVQLIAFWSAMKVSTAHCFRTAWHIKIKRGRNKKCLESDMLKKF